jgi:tRNA threonylcarbamoyl adenosine modification protein (Sua5/YciO/YrdC/YwlC family)
METKIIKLNPDKPDIHKIRIAADIVAGGGLAAFPTETVYGLACRVSNKGMAKLGKLKGRDENKYYTLHIGDKNQLGKYVAKLSLREKKLVENAWPGPLTIIFELSDDEISRVRKTLDKEVLKNLYKNNSIGVRCPDNAVAAALLTETQCAVVAPSANYSGAEAAVTTEQVINAFDGKIEIILDSGPTKYQQSSTVAKIGKKGVEILRQGVYSQEQIVDFCTVQVLFVCTGNTCRSPTAGGIFAKDLAEKLGCAVDQLEQMGYKIRSAGTMGAIGWPASPEAVSVCKAHGIDISAHASSALTEELIRQSDLIYVMSHDHAEHVLRLSPDSSVKCLRLADDKDVPDPIGQDEEFYKKCFAMIEQAAAKRIGELKL